MHIPMTYDTLRKVFLAVGTVGLATSCLMVWKFGSSMSTLHAVGLCLIAIMAAFIFPAREFIRQSGHKVAANAILVVGIFFVGLEFFSDLGYTIGMREKSTVEATAQTVAYKHEQQSLESEQANLTMWRQQLASLQEANGWVASVRADGLRAQIDSASEAIKQEEKRGGCGPRCLKLKQDKGALEDKIAKAEAFADLSKRIEATQRIIDGKTRTAVDTKVGFSPVKAQTDFVGQLWLIATGADGEKALNPDAVTLSLTQIVIGFFIALGATFLPTTAFYLAFWGQPIDKIAAVATRAGEAVRDVVHEAREIVTHEVHEVKERDPRINGAVAYLSQFQAA